VEVRQDGATTAIKHKNSVSCQIEAFEIEMCCVQMAEQQKFNEREG
jgi:hypothetical protein